MPDVHRKVLLVEDDEDDYLLTRELVADIPEARFDVHWVRSCPAALDRMEREEFDAVLVDYQLGEHTGLELIAEALARSYRAPMILLTGHNNYELDFQAMQVGAAEYLAKTELSATLLERTIRYSIERGQAQAALKESNQQLQLALAELKETQQQIIQQERLRALGEMASGVAHDFNNALAPIVAYSELLLVRPDDLKNLAKAREYLEMIHTAAADAAHVVRRLQEFSRERRPSEMTELVNIEGVITQAVSLTQFRWKDQALASGRTIELRTDLQPVPPVHGSAADLREVLTNLVFNAVDALPAGGVITIQTRKRDQDVVVFVADDGTGMSAETRKRCLDPFFTTKGDRGTGLGLPMVYGVVKRHGGQVTIASEEGHGTSVCFSLPLPRPNAAPTPLSLQLDTGSSPLRVLVVDDELTMRHVLSEFLRADGHAVDTAFDGADGAEKLTAGQYDLVLTDRAMPRVSGDQFALMVKQLAPQTPVIMLTGFGELMQETHERPAAVDLILSKPIGLATLRAAIARVCPAHLWSVA